MKKNIIRYTCLLLAFVICLSMFSANVYANGQMNSSESTASEKEVNSGSGTSEVNTAVVSYVNPLYEDVVQESDLISSTSSYNDEISTAEASEYCTSVEAAGAEIRSHLRKREESIEVGLVTGEVTTEEVQNLAREIAEEALEHTGDPVEGDYLKWQFEKWSCSISYYTRSDETYITYTYTYTYYTTKAQEDKVDSEVEKLLSQLNLSGKSNYNKIKGIYDYICENVTYDHENLNDDDYKLKYTAYAALINKTAVCQGYAVLFYRLALELDVDARLIPGKGNGESHAWNIARIDKKYYNLDSTWDAGEEEYSYFLKCNANFKNHVRDEAYDTDEFNAAYPMGTEDYVPAETENPFVDVPEDAYYTDAVIWAYKNGITTGVDETHFGPEKSCTRGQVVTFLWRAEGQPEAKSQDCPFVDLETGGYYYEAVLWAYENGIVNGVDEQHFKPDDTVTRGQFVTFLHRAQGEPASVSTECPFVDVEKDAYYADAVMWAYENEITTGMDETHFKPENPCNRAQVVTFLYRAYE